MHVICVMAAIFVNYWFLIQDIKISMDVMYVITVNKSREHQSQFVLFVHGG
jgi:hypothetical protein